MKKKVENGTVEVPRDYFLRMAKLDYNSYRQALAREFFQNSSDAQASVIEVIFDEEARSITVVDDGVGMDYDTIKNKLLVLGGSKKRVGDTGAFGKAKEVLYFSWEKYEVRTRNLIVKGQGAEYTIETVDSSYRGCTSTIWIWDAEEFSSIRSAFRYVAQKFQIDCTIIVNEETMESTLLRGRLVRSMGWADLYVDSSNVDAWQLQCRINGQWMFSSYHGETGLGQLVLELKENSADCLNSNRDGLKGDFNSQFMQLVKELVTDKKSALEAENPTIRTMYEGTGKVCVNYGLFKEEIELHIGEVLEDGSGKASDIIQAVIDSIPSENITPVKMDRLKAAVKNRDFTFDAARLAFIGYEPDFVTVYEDKDSKRVEKFMKSSQAKIIAKAWTEVVRQVLLDVEWYGQFTAGFNFEGKKAAAYELVDGEVYFYLNPDLLISDVPKKDAKFGPLVHKVMFREDLKAKAIHEVTHLWKGLHNEDFMLRCEYVRAQTWKSQSIYPKIIKEAFAKAL